MRTVIAAVVAATIVSTSIGFALGAASQPPAAQAAPTAAASSPEYKMLRDIDRRLGALAGIQKTLGRPGATSLQDQLYGIEAILGSAPSCSDDGLDCRGLSISAALNQIAANTAK